MSDNVDSKASKQTAKARKKLDKAQSKTLKKAPVGGAEHGGAEPAAAPGPAPPGSSPAERSAAAAERQVRMQRMRVWLAALTLLVAVATFLATAKPWRQPGGAEPATPEPTSRPSVP